MSDHLSFGQLLTKDILNIVLTALLVGLSVPAIKSIMDDRYFRKQKDHERQIRLQENLLAKKIKLLEETSAAYWKFYFCCVKLTYAACQDDPKLPSLYKSYEEEVWRVLSEIRQVTSPASYLLSPHELKATIGHFLKHLEEIDAEVSAAARNNKFDWREIHDRRHEGLALEINQVLQEFAQALKITAAELSAG